MYLHVFLSLLLKSRSIVATDQRQVSQNQQELNNAPKSDINAIQQVMIWQKSHTKLECAESK